MRTNIWRVLLPLLLLLPTPGQASPAAAALRGVVADARGGERLERVRLRLAWLAEGGHEGPPVQHEAVTGGDGSFGFGTLPPGEYELVVSTVGYRLFRQKITLAPGGTLELEIALSPEAFTQREKVEVTARVFEPLETLAPTEQTLTHSEVKNLGSVLADDPLRAVQSLPGVATGDDFESRFALRGAAFRNIGMYLDGVLLHAPFHTVHSGGQSGSMTMLNGDLVENLSLLSSGFSARYGDRTAGILAIQSREGGRLRPTARLTASASNAGILAEGPLSAARHGSWLVAFRKSYLDYIIRRTSSDDSLAFGFLDGQGRLVQDFGTRYQLNFQAASGRSALDRSHFRDRLGLNSAMETDSRLTLAALGLRYLPGPRLLVTTQVSAMRETFVDWNKERAPLESGRYREAAGRADVTWYWAARQPLEFGAVLRRGQDEAVRAQSLGAGRGYSEWERYRGDSWTSGGYFQQSWSWRRLRLGAGLRFDWFSPTREMALGPRASLSLFLPGSQWVHLGWGQYSQFPDQHALVGVAGHAALSAERATQMMAAWEWQAQERTRVRIEFYDREDRNGLFRPFGEPRRLASQAILRPARNSPYENSLRGYGRGAEFTLQRRSANRLTGWLSYAYSRAELRDTRTGLRFPADYDQRHTFTFYGSYRVRPSVNLSGKWLAGSGFPIPGFFQRAGSGFALAEERNRRRIDSYQRLDLRINKSLLAARRRLTLYGEVINLFNRRNVRFNELSSYNAATGNASLRFDRMFPIIPSAGLVLEF